MNDEARKIIEENWVDLVNELALISAEQDTRINACATAGMLLGKHMMHKEEEVRRLAAQVEKLTAELDMVKGILELQKPESQPQI